MNTPRRRRFRPILLILCLAGAGMCLAASEITGVQRVYQPGNVNGRTRMLQDFGVPKFDHLRYQSEQETYYVFWNADASMTDNPVVIFSFRQANRRQPGSLQIKYPFKVAGPRKATFTIREQSLKQYGPVTAWRVQVVSGGGVVSEKRSASWR